MSPNQLPPEFNSKKAKRLNNISRAIRRKASKHLKNTFDYYEHEMRNDRRIRQGLATDYED